MRLLKVLALLCCAFLLIAIVQVKTARADEWNKKTIFTFSGPVEIPGFKGPMVLPAGTYVFKLLDNISNRDIVQIFNKDQNHLYSTVIAIPDYRMKPTGSPVIKFEERASNAPQAVKAWFYPGDDYGQEFVYPKARAVELAKNTNEPVLSMPDEMASNMAQPNKSAKESSVMALEKTPVKAEEPGGQEVEMSQVVTPQPSADAPRTEAMNTTNKELPKTASLMPLWALSGLLLCAAGAGLRLASTRRTAS